MSKPWQKMDWTMFCSSCGLKKKTRFPAGDFLQLCETCFQDKTIKQAKETELMNDKDPPARVQSEKRTRRTVIAH